eukprot:IDg8662t1
MRAWMSCALRDNVTDENNDPKDEIEYFCSVLENYALIGYDGDVVLSDVQHE